MTTTSASVSREELLRRAVAMAPKLRERAFTAEKNERVSEETVQELIGAGLIRVSNPDRFGGYGHDYDMMFEVAMELGRSCGSTAWCFAVWTNHNWMIGYWPLEHQEEHFAGGPDAVASTAVTPVATSPVKQSFQKLDGGYRLSGQWRFSSGCDSATWILFSAEGENGRQWVSVPASDYRILDTWHVSGLRGTGSKDVVVEDIFVPAHRVIPMAGMGDAPYTAWDLHGRGSYRVPLSCIWALTLAAPLIGIAQGAVDAFTERVGGLHSRSRSAHSPGVQLSLAEAAAEVDGARTLLRRDAREMIARGLRGEPFSELERARYRRNHGFIGKLCLQAVNRLFDVSGGNSLYETEAIQRFHRDAHAAGHHLALGWFGPAEQYGRLVLGLEPVEGIF